MPAPVATESAQRRGIEIDPVVRGPIACQARHMTETVSVESNAGSHDAVDLI